LKKDDTETDEARGGEAHRAEAAARVGPNTQWKNWGVIHGNIYGSPARHQGRDSRVKPPVFSLLKFGPTLMACGSFLAAARPNLDIGILLSLIQFFIDVGKLCKGAFIAGSTWRFGLAAYRGMYPVDVCIYCGSVE